MAEKGESSRVESWAGGRWPVGQQSTKAKGCQLSSKMPIGFRCSRSEPRGANDVNIFSSIRANVDKGDKGVEDRRNLNPIRSSRIPLTFSLIFANVANPDSRFLDQSRSSNSASSRAIDAFVSYMKS